MIPFSIMFCIIENHLGDQREIRILDLSPDYFTFRLSYGDAEIFQEISDITLYFMQRELCNKKYEKLNINTYDIKVEQKEKYWVKYRVDVKDEEYWKASKQLTTDYLSYVQAKLYSTDHEISVQYTSYPEGADDIYDMSYDQFKTRLSLELKDHFYQENMKFPPIPWKMALALESISMINDFIKKDFSQFCHEYWKKWELEWHPYAHEKVKGIYVGNPYCSILFPEEDQFEMIFQKAIEENLELVFVFPPIAQSSYSKALKKVNLIHEKSLSYGKKTSIICNDQGFFSDLIYKYPDLMVRQGFLLAKNKRDPRMKYLGKDSHHLLNKGENEIYLPYYQMNTATYCTLYSQCKYGCREKTERITECPIYCDQNYFLYPSHLNVIGKYNSILGFAKYAFSLETMMEEGEEKEWLVMNL